MNVHIQLKDKKFDKGVDIAFSQKSHITRDEEAAKFKRSWVGKV